MTDALQREINLLELKGKIESAAQEEMTDAQKEYFLRQQLKAIQKELGEGDKPERGGRQPTNKSNRHVHTQRCLVFAIALRIKPKRAPADSTSKGGPVV